MSLCLVPCISVIIQCLTQSASTLHLIQRNYLPFLITNQADCSQSLQFSKLCKTALSFKVNWYIHPIMLIPVLSKFTTCSTLISWRKLATNHSNRLQLSCEDKIIRTVLCCTVYHNPIIWTHSLSSSYSWTHILEISQAVDYTGTDRVCWFFSTTASLKKIRFRSVKCVLFGCQYQCSQLPDYVGRSTLLTHSLWNRGNTA